MQTLTALLLVLEFGDHALGESDDRVLGAAVRGLQWNAAKCQRRPDLHDDTAVSRPHVFQRHPGAVDLSEIGHLGDLAKHRSGVSQKYRSEPANATLTHSRIGPRSCWIFPPAACTWARSATSVGSASARPPACSTSAAAAGKPPDRARGWRRPSRCGLARCRQRGRRRRIRRSRQRPYAGSQRFLSWFSCWLSMTRSSVHRQPRMAKVAAGAASVAAVERQRGDTLAKATPDSQCRASTVPPARARRETVSPEGVRPEPDAERQECAPSRGAPCGMGVRSRASTRGGPARECRAQPARASVHTRATEHHRRSRDGISAASPSCRAWQRCHFIPHRMGDATEDDAPTTTDTGPEQPGRRQDQADAGGAGAGDDHGHDDPGDRSATLVCTVLVEAAPYSAAWWWGWVFSVRGGGGGGGVLVGGERGEGGGGRGGGAREGFGWARFASDSPSVLGRVDVSPTSP